MVALDSVWVRSFLCCRVFSFHHTTVTVTYVHNVLVGAAWRDVGEQKDRKAFSSVLEMVRQVMDNIMLIVYRR